MGNKQDVGDPDISVSSRDLKQVFREHGTVAAAMVVTDRESGRSQRFGFGNWSLMKPQTPPSIPFPACNMVAENGHQNYPAGASRQAGSEW